MFIFATVIGMVPRKVIAFGTAYNVSTSDTSIEVSKDQRNWQSGGGSFTEYSTVYFRVPASTDTISVKDSNDNEIAYWGVSASGQTASYGFHMPSSDVSISITFATEYKVRTNSTFVEISNDQINWQSEGSFIASSTVYFRVPSRAETISVKDSSNNVIEYWEASVASASGQTVSYGFYMPASDVSISITFATEFIVSTNNPLIEVSTDKENWQSEGSFSEYSTVYFRVPIQAEDLQVTDSQDKSIEIKIEKRRVTVESSNVIYNYYSFKTPSSDVSISIKELFTISVNDSRIEFSIDFQNTWHSEDYYASYNNHVYIRVPSTAESISFKNSNNEDVPFSEYSDPSFPDYSFYWTHMPDSDLIISIYEPYTILLPQIEHISFEFGMRSYDEDGNPVFLSGMFPYDENGNPLCGARKLVLFRYSVEDGYMIRDIDEEDYLSVLFDWSDDGLYCWLRPGDICEQRMPESNMELLIRNPEAIVCIPYTATLYSNGGAIDDTSWQADNLEFKTGFNIESDTIHLPIPTKENCTFAGWYTDPDFSGSPVTCIEKGTIGNVTLYAKWDTETDVGFSGHYLVLDDEICVNFRVDFPENFDPTGCYVEFLASDGEKSIVSYSAAKQVEGSASRDFSFPINALELAEDITATLYYGDGNTKVNTYSAMAYIQDAQVKFANDMRVLNLVNALHAYGYYMQQTDWKDDKPSHKAIPAPSMLLDAGDTNHCALYIDQYEVTKDFNSSGITDAKLSLTLTSKTAINVAVKLDDGVEMISSGYETIDIGGDTYYLFTLAKGIGPKGLGDDRAITITTSTGEAEITASAMAYVDLLFSSDFVTEAEEYALVAYYYYYLAALEY